MWKTGISWTEYQPTPSEMAEVRAIFRQFGREDHGTLADIQSALLLVSPASPFILAVPSRAAVTRLSREHSYASSQRRPQVDDVKGVSCHEADRCAVHLCRRRTG